MILPQRSVPGQLRERKARTILQELTQVITSSLTAQHKGRTRVWGDKKAEDFLKASTGSPPRNPAVKLELKDRENQMSAELKDWSCPRKELQTPASPETARVTQAAAQTLPRFPRRTRSPRSSVGYVTSDCSSSYLGSIFRTNGP